MNPDPSREDRGRARREPPTRRREPRRAASPHRGAGALVVAALLLTVVWLAPLALAFFAVTDPVAVYQGSPAEPRQAFTDMSAGDQSYVTLLIQVFGGIVALISLGGLFLTWGPVRRGRTAAFVVAAAVTLGIVAIAAWLHTQGFWAVYPIWVPGAAWLLGVAAGIVGLAMAPRRDAPPRVERGRTVG